MSPESTPIERPDERMYNSAEAGRDSEVLTAQKELTKCLRLSKIDDAKALIERNILTETQVREIVQKELERLLFDGKIDTVKRLIELDLLKEEQMKTPEIQTAAQRGLVHLIEIGHAGEESLTNAKKLIMLNILTDEQKMAPEVQEMAQARLRVFLGHYAAMNIDRAEKLISLGLLSEDQIHGPAMLSAAQEGLRLLLQRGGYEQELKKLIDLGFLTKEQAREAGAQFYTLSDYR